MHVSNTIHHHATVLLYMYTVPNTIHHHATTLSQNIIWISSRIPSLSRLKPTLRYTFVSKQTTSTQSDPVLRPRFRLFLAQYLQFLWDNCLRCMWNPTATVWLKDDVFQDCWKPSVFLPKSGLESSVLTVFFSKQTWVFQDLFLFFSSSVNKCYRNI